MTAHYRDAHTQYRQPGVPYRGAPEAIPGVDMDRFDNIQIRVVDKFGALIRELPAAAVGPVEWKRNDAGDVDITLSAYDPFAQYLAIGELDVQIVFSNTIDTDTGEALIWWGTHSQNRRGPGKLIAGMQDIEVLLDDRLVKVDKDYVNVEQLDIAADLVNYAQTGTNMDLNIDVAAYAASGRLRERHYAGDQKPPIRRLLHNFNNLIDGFDWHMEYYIAGQRLWVPDYPTRGVHSNVVFEWGKNIVGYDFPEDATALITRYYAQGGTDGDGVKHERSYEDLAASAKYGVREAAGMEGDNNSTDELLDSRAQWKVTDGKQPRWTLSLAVWEGSQGDDSQPTPILGRVHPGDWCMVLIDDGVNQVAQELRVNSIKWLPKSGLDVEFALT